MNELIKVCATGDVASEMTALEIQGFPPLAAFNVDGRIYITSNVCTHNTALLTDGYFENDIVECPLHGGTFNVCTGKALSFPCEIALQTYEVVVQGGAVFVRAPADASCPKKAA